MKHFKLNILPKQFKKDEYPIKFNSLRDLNHNTIPLNKITIRCEIQYEFRTYSDISYSFDRKENELGQGTHSRLETIIVIPLRRHAFARTTSWTSIRILGAKKLLKVNIKDGIRDHT